MSRIISLDKVNDIIDDKVRQYENAAEEAIQEYEDEARGNELLAKAQALTDFKIEINDPEPATNLTENVQQSLNLIETDKLINPPKGD
jgi:hypothetical protein